MTFTEIFCSNIGGSDCTRAVNVVIKELVITIILSDNGGHVYGHLNYKQAVELNKRLTTKIKEWEKEHPPIKK